MNESASNFLINRGFNERSRMLSSNSNDTKDVDGVGVVINILRQEVK